MSDLSTLQAQFTQHIPTMERMARLQFRHLPPEAKQESITNAIALAWKFIYRLFLRGRSEEPGILNSCLRYAIRQTREGRTPQGCPRVRDAFHGRRFGTVKFEDFDLDNFVSRDTPVADQVAFRVDVPAFLGTLNDRQRRMAMDLAWGMTTTEAATKYSLSLGRISQFRREFKELFDEFFAE